MTSTEVSTPHRSPRLALIILSWNSPEDVLECVESLTHSHILENVGIKVIIVDNGSNEATREVVSKIPETTYVQTGKNLGFGGGNNVGIRRALEQGFEYVMLLNQDTIVDPNCFNALLKAIERDQTIGIAGPLIYDYHDRDKLIFAGGKLNWLKTKGKHLIKVPFDSAQGIPGEPVEPYDVDYVTGGALLAKRELIETIGLLPEEYFLYFEDVEWNWKAKKAGYRTVVVPQAKIWHKVSTTAKASSPAYIAYHFRNGLHFAWKVAPFWKKPVVWFWSLWMALKQALKLILGYRRAWAWAILSGITEFWKGKQGEII